jgi:hypothetical protein
MAGYLTKGVIRANTSVTYLIVSRIADSFRSATTAEEKQTAQKDFWNF